jgi:four helix bundle protein
MTSQPSLQRQRTLALQQRSFNLSCNVIKAYPRNQSLDEASRILWRQLIRAVSSSTFNLEEADAASSDADFLSKMRIALREAKETRVAIRLINACQLAGAAAVGKYEDEANQMASIFSAIVQNKRASMARKKSSP